MVLEEAQASEVSLNQWSPNFAVYENHLGVFKNPDAQFVPHTNQNV